MANTYETMNADPQVGQVTIEDLKRGIAKFQETCTDMTSGFSKLTTVTPDLGVQYLNELNGSAEDILKFMGYILTKATDYFSNDLTPTPDNPKTTKEEDAVPASPKDGVDGGGGGGGTGGGGGGGNTPATIPDSGITPVTIPPINVPTLPPTIPEIDINLPKIDLDKIDTKPLEDMSLSSLSGFGDELINLSEINNKKLDEMVEDPAFADDIKKLILDSPYIPQSFKDIIIDMTSEEARQVIEAMLKGQLPDVFALNPLNLGIIYSHLLQIAQENGITVEDLLSNPEYADLLETTLKDFKDIIDLLKSWEELTPEEFQANLLKLYDGDDVAELSDTAISTVRLFVDYISEETGISYEELLTDKEYAETMKEAALEFGKCATFFNITSYFTEEGMRNNASQMFDGTNYKVFGMTEENIENFKQEMDTLAQENNTSVENLLTNEEYAEVVRDALNNSEHASGVGNIFKNAEATVPQNVAKNLYETDFTKNEIISDETRKAVEKAMNVETTTSTTTIDTTERDSLVRKSENGLLDVSQLRKRKE